MVFTGARAIGAPKRLRAEYSYSAWIYENSRKLSLAGGDDLTRDGQATLVIN
jgi:hypothetical protein